MDAGFEAALEALVEDSAPQRIEADDLEGLAFWYDSGFFICAGRLPVSLVDLLFGVDCFLRGWSGTSGVDGMLGRSCENSGPELQVRKEGAVAEAL